MKTAEDRFWEKVDKSGECWLWTAGTSKGKDGYGLFSAHGKKWIASRYSWTLANGPIPSGLYVCHNCPGGDNKRCVNPAHLWLGTSRENTLDASRKGDLKRPHTTYCRKGHLLSGDNLHVTRAGTQTCLTCRRRWSQENRNRVKDEIGVTRKSWWKRPRKSAACASPASPRTE